MFLHFVELVKITSFT